MYPLHTVEGLLFRSYLANYNLSLLHTCIRSATEAYENEAWQKAAFAKSTYEFKKRVLAAGEKTRRTLDTYTVMGVRMLPFFENDYPATLRVLKDYPPLLFVQGQLPTLPLAAVVGTRQPSPLAGVKVAAIVRILAQKGWGVLSGLALGIDTLAHASALHSHAYTLAVLPTAIGTLYPPENEPLAEAILREGGALLSELAPGLHPVANTFVLRNRIQAALSTLVLPVEMGRDSGTSHTLAYARRYHKTIILCLPGTTEIDQHLPQYEGLLAAIKRGRRKEGSPLVVLKTWQDLAAQLSIPAPPPTLF
jgi:DNA processing protein